MKRSEPGHDAVFDQPEFASEYARKHEKMASDYGERIYKKLISRGFSGGRVIDVGCGFGSTLIVLAGKFPDSEFTGIDLSEPLLKLAETRARRAGLKDRLAFEQIDVHEPKYPDDSFDVVINLNMVHIVTDAVRMLNSVERILKTDGRFFISDLRRTFLGLLEKEIMSSYSVSEAREIIGQSDLRSGRWSTGLIWWHYEG